MLKIFYKTVIFMKKINFDMIEKKIYFIYYSYLIKFDKKYF